MHRAILGLALLLAGQALAAPPHCPRSPQRVLERFVPADCPTCWADAGDSAPDAWVLDWIVPAASGDEAALAAAALPESAARQRRAGARPARAVLLPMDPTRLRVAAGPALAGYFGVQLTWRGAVPAGATAWLALVEQLPAGSEGNAQPRSLVRTLAGPLPLPRGAATSHTVALRWPEGARPERLHARGWLEDDRGRLLALAGERCR